MKTFIIIYLIGFISTGIIYRLLHEIRSFYNYRLELIETAKSELDSEINNSVMDINSEEVINLDIIVTMLFSFIGMIHVIFACIGWVTDSIINKN